MKRSKRHTIIADNRSVDFVGRENEIERLIRYANNPGAVNGLAILATPSSGASELLRQVYDRLFTGGGDVIPVYFAVKKSDGSATQAAIRFVKEFLVQTIAFRRSDANILDASPGMDELSELATPADGYWIDRLIEADLSDGNDRDERASLQSCLSSPLRAGSNGASVFVMIDDLHHLPYLQDGGAFLECLSGIYSRAELSFVLAGHRRFLFGKTPFESVPLDHFNFSEAGVLAEKLSSKYQVAINDQTRDLIAVQTRGNPAFMNFLFAAAQEKGEPLDSFQRVESIYTDEIFGGRICKFYDEILDRIIPDSAAQTRFLHLIKDVANSDADNAPTAFWKNHLGLASAEFSRAITSLNNHEIVSLNSNSVAVASENTALGDYLNCRIRLEIDGESRALAVGEALSGFITRAPELMARVYRQRSSIGLRELMLAFDGRQITRALIDYARFKDEFKGAGDDKILKAANDDNDKIGLPQIVYTAHTAAFYRPIGKLFDAERSAVALGFAENAETVWIAAEIDSKLEAARDVAEFWCDRLEMVAANCGFEQYKLWLVAPEGFDAEAMNILSERNAYGSSRKQVDLLVQFLNVQELAKNTGVGEEYEIVVPMGEDAELMSARTVEEIAKRHAFPAKTINQIKTALIEACINAAEHSLSPDRKIYQKFTVTDEKITVTVSNRGIRMTKPGKSSLPARGGVAASMPSIGVDGVVEEATGSTDDQRRGWGLKLIKGLMDDVRIEQTDDGTRITMVKYLKKA